jgi:hydrogenase nickel incorporation protein HypB
MNGTHLRLAGIVANSNERLENENRKIFDALGVFAINLMGSPGSGKTHLILRTIQGLSAQLQIGVVEGDTTSVTLDSEQVMASGVPVTEVNTGGIAGLDATMLSSAMAKLPLSQLDLVLVENVGNLILPASPKLGTHANVLVASVPEGDDKPYKYPSIYSSADVVILNKTDLLPAVPFDLAYFRRGIQRVNPAALVFLLSAYTGADVHRWFDWLFEQCGLPKKASAMQRRPK